jgi:hypothetical protein
MKSNSKITEILVYNTEIKAINFLYPVTPYSPV